AMYQTAIMQHRQIETRTIPAHQLWGVALDGFKKSPNQHVFRVGCLTNALDLKTVVISKYASDGNNPLQVQRQEIMADRFDARLLRPFNDFFIAQGLGPIIQCPNACGIRDRLEIKNKGWRHT